jgi:hypothetical protein
MLNLWKMTWYIELHVWCLHAYTMFSVYPTLYKIFPACQHACLLYILSIRLHAYLHVTMPVHACPAYLPVWLSGCLHVHSQASLHTLSSLGPVSPSVYCTLSLSLSLSFCLSLKPFSLSLPLYISPSQFLGFCISLSVPQSVSLSFNDAFSISVYLDLSVCQSEVHHLKWFLERSR